MKIWKYVAVTGIMIAGGVAMAQEPDRMAPPSASRADLKLGDCTLDIAATRSRYPALSKFLTSQLTQDFDLLHDNDIKKAIQNFRKSDKDNAKELKAEFKAFRKDFQSADCKETAWAALGAQSGIDVRFIDRSLDDVDGMTDL